MNNQMTVAVDLRGRNADTVGSVDSVLTVNSVFTILSVFSVHSDNPVEIDACSVGKSEYQLSLVIDSCRRNTDPVFTVSAVFPVGSVLAVKTFQNRKVVKVQPYFIVDITPLQDIFAYAKFRGFSVCTVRSVLSGGALYIGYRNKILPLVALVTPLYVGFGSLHLYVFGVNAVLAVCSVFAVCTVGSVFTVYAVLSVCTVFSVGAVLSVLAVFSVGAVNAVFAVDTCLLYTSDAADD